MGACPGPPYQPWPGGHGGPPSLPVRPRFFFLGLAAPPALGLIRLGAFSLWRPFPPFYRLLFPGALSSRAGWAGLFRFGRLVLFHLRTFRTPPPAISFFKSGSGDHSPRRGPSRASWAVVRRPSLLGGRSPGRGLGVGASWAGAPRGPGHRQSWAGDFLRAHV